MSVPFAALRPCGFALNFNCRNVVQPELRIGMAEKARKAKFPAGERGG